MRLHLIEFHEQNWVPQVLRRGVTDYLKAANEVAGYDNMILPLLKQRLQDSGQTKILDMGSGAGGAWEKLFPKLQAEMEQPVRVTLSDANPRIDAWKRLQAELGDGLDFNPESVDARSTSARGLRTMFNLFHHFQPNDARAILQDAADQQQPILIVETLEKGFIQGLMIFLLAPIMTLFLTPMIRPFRWWRILFTYLIPILPLMIAWDGLVSIIRIHDESSMKKWTQEIGGMDWSVGGIRQKNLYILYLSGAPKSGS